MSQKLPRAPFESTFILYLLALRHTYLDYHVYVTLVTAQEEACKNVRIVISTGTQLLKVNGLLSHWSEWLSTKRKLFGLFDEAEYNSLEETVGMAWPFDYAVFAGDEKQAPWLSRFGHVSPSATASSAHK